MGKLREKLVRKQAFRWLSLLLAAILVVGLGIRSPLAAPKVTETLWDTYGVPHIFAKDGTEAFQAFGRSQMQSHGNLILRLYGQARGRASEYWGEKYLESDRWVRTMGVPDRAQQWYAAQNPDFRRHLDAFAAGVNAYAREHPDSIDDRVEVVLPITGVDLLAHVQRVLHFTFMVDPEVVAELAEPESKSSRTPRTFSYGSNAWAIAPSHSASGNAMLLANPHLPWSDLFLWYEAQIKAPGIDAYGATLVGVPVLAIAFNDRLGWAHTVNTHDGWDAYQLTLADGGYRFDGQIRPWESETQTIKVKQADGTLRAEKLTVKRSIHGPIVAEKDGKAIALRVVGLDRSGVLQQWWDMARATNLAEFETVLSRLQLPMFTVMYADDKGHIMHLFNGQVPVRDRGDYEYWEGLIPGDTSATLWTTIHPYRDLPRTIDPPSGWLQNTNDPPWTTTFPSPLDPDDYPPYMAPRGPMDFRAQRSVRMLSEDKSISLAEMVKSKHSTRMELSDRLLDDLIPLAQKQDNPRIRRAVRVLKSWDRQANANSRGAVLFAFWFDEMDFPTAFATPWNENSPRTTPDGLADPQTALSALDRAAVKVEAMYSKLDVPWGEVFRLRYGDVDLPANGGSGELGIFRVVDSVPDADGKFKAIAGDSYVAAIQFSRPVKAMALNSYGNSSQADSPYVGDRLQLFDRQQLHPVWRSRQEILAHRSAASP
ncbi:MAG: acylase [Cyanosarcina radialis HA8281-LM2]|jgi:acyl-homoserine-lactone acylase|nr:acylase [Cyanosarcina radialis HA8281-LM2]